MKTKLMLASLVAVLAVVAVRSLRPAEGQGWKAWSNPEAGGFDSTRLKEVYLTADRLRSGAVFVLYRGRVLVDWGATDRTFMAHSVRKSLVSAMYGILVGDGRVDLDATLSDLHIDDATPLTDTERMARVRDLLAARSGVYLPAAYAPADQDAMRPARGSHPPGTHWFYNNWDFNVAGVIMEQLSGDDTYELFDRLIAAPIGMEDYRATDGVRIFEPSLSQHPAHTFRISARDLGRFGQLFLQGGRWHDHQIIPQSWVTESTRAISEFGDGSGYGFMWWTFESGAYGDRYPELNRFHGYMARGTGGQLLMVLPDADLVFVHRGDTDHNREVGGSDVLGLADRLLSARRGVPEPDAQFVEVVNLPFQSQLPAPVRPAFVELGRSAWSDYHGEYQIAPDVALRVFEWNGRTFMAFPGRGEGEMFALGDDRFTIEVIAGVEILFDRNDNGDIVSVEVALGEQKFFGRRK